MPRSWFAPGSRLPSYLVLLRVGFALPAALLRRRCALTAPFHPYPAVLVKPGRARGLTRTAERYIFCGTFRRTDLNPASRTLSGTLLCGVRTFLSSHPKTREATVRSSCQQDHYMRRAGRSCLQSSEFPAYFAEECFSVFPARQADKLSRTGKELRHPDTASRKPNLCTSSKPSESRFSRSG